ncbi:MAG: TetR/AcrR family transcriptional regulator, partial [Planctomycetota bacterium]
MGITERREREREEIRTRILDAARELFDSEGYEHVTMRRIADAIEYSPTTIYNHFTDKDDLVDALCHEEFSHLLSALDRVPQHGEGLAGGLAG